jgi:hypothetical protein
MSTTYFRVQGGVTNRITSYAHGRSFVPVGSIRTRQVLGFVCTYSPYVDSSYLPRRGSHSETHCLIVDHAKITRPVRSRRGVIRASHNITAAAYIQHPSVLLCLASSLAIATFGIPSVHTSTVPQHILTYEPAVT